RGIPPLPRLGMAHPIIRQVAKANHGRTANTANNNNFADLAHDIVTFKRSQFASSRLFEYRNAKLEQVHKRIRTRCPTAERLQLSTGRTNLANIPLRDFTRPQHSQKLTICLSPTFLAIL